MSGLGGWRYTRISRVKIDQLFYFTLANNLDTILNHGILAKNEVQRRNLMTDSFANEGVQIRRHNKDIQISNYKTVNVHDLVPVYLCPRTPTLYAAMIDNPHLVFICVDAKILCDENINFAFTDGNAACTETVFYRNLNDLDKVPWDIIRAHSWTGLPDAKRKRNAEFLIHPQIETKWFQKLVVKTEETKNIVTPILRSTRSPLNCVVDVSFFSSKES